jgi:hypothetical protein
MITARYTRVKETTYRIACPDAVLDAPRTWDIALKLCQGITIEDRSWRLPSRTEVEALIEAGQLDLGDKEVWTRDSADLDNAYGVDAYGTVKTHPKTDKLYLLPVTVVTRGESTWRASFQ